jgi:ABC-type glycerol-3-phosphate transport system substrate-binding protein
MKLSKITKKQIVDVLIRTAKTFIAAGLGAVTTLGPDDVKTWIITFGSAGATAVLNLIIKAFTEEE